MVDLSVEEPAVEDVLLCELEVDVLPLQAQLLAEGPEIVRESDAHADHHGQEVNVSIQGEVRHDRAGGENEKDHEDVTQGLQDVQQHVQLQHSAGFSSYYRLLFLYARLFHHPRSLSIENQTCAPSTNIVPSKKSTTNRWVMNELFITNFMTCPRCSGLNVRHVSSGWIAIQKVTATNIAK